jgi:uncharacterized protein (DUF433 family)
MAEVQVSCPHRSGVGIIDKSLLHSGRFGEKEGSMAIADTLVATPPPLRLDPNGTLYVGETRVPLDTVVGVYGMGVSPEEIVRRYDTLRLADVYRVLSYYLANREEIDAYLSKRQRFASEVRAEN